MPSAALERAIAFATESQQPVLWDRAEQPWAIALYDSKRKELHALTDIEAGRLLNRDKLIRKQWCRWNAVNQNQGSLIVIDPDRVQRWLNGGGVGDTF